MSKRMRQYIGILAAVAAYYLVHEGAHLLYALLTGVFKQIWKRILPVYRQSFSGR